MDDGGQWWDRLAARARAEVGRRLFAAALYLQAQAKRDYSVPNPRPHKNPAPKGEFPRARTFNLRDAVVVRPGWSAEVARSGSVKVGILKNAHYGAILSRKGWKGIHDTYRTHRPQVVKLIGG